MTTTKHRQISKPNNKETANQSLSTEELMAKKFKTIIFKFYGVTLKSRQRRIEERVYYGCREKLAYAIMGQMNGQAEKFDWQAWNKLFAKVFGDIDSIKYSAKFMALTISKLDDAIPEEPKEAIAALIEYNKESLKRRNERRKARDDVDIDELEDELEELDDVLDKDEFDEDDEFVVDEGEDEDEFDDED